MVGFEEALGAVKVIKDQIQYRSQRLLNLACSYFSFVITKEFIHFFITKFVNLFFCVDFTQIKLAVSSEDAFRELLSFCF